jgi:hypothetical protein
VARVRASTPPTSQYMPSSRHPIALRTPKTDDGTATRAHRRGFRSLPPASRLELDKALFAVLCDNRWRPSAATKGRRWNRVPDYWKDHNRIPRLLRMSFRFTRVLPSGGDTSKASPWRHSLHSRRCDLRQAGVRRH